MDKLTVSLQPQEDGTVIVRLFQGDVSLHPLGIYTLPAKPECKLRDIKQAMQKLVDSVSTKTVDTSMTWLDES